MSRLDGLLPNNIYQLRVISVNSIGLGPPSLEIVAQTKEEGMNTVGTSLSTKLRKLRKFTQHLVNDTVPDLCPFGKSKFKLYKA